MADETTDNNKDTLFEFPCDFPIKIIGRMEDDIGQTSFDILYQHFPNLDKENITTRPSKDSTYLAITATLYVESKSQIDNFYRELSAHPKIMMVL